MAVTLESFSIREYAAKMRSVDFGKCWPFDGDGREHGKRGGEIGSSLPPISFRKFRWWSDELDVARSTAEKSPAKAKQRTPKKRSIVELFAVAPQIVTVDEDDVDDGEEEPDLEDREQENESSLGGREKKRKEWAIEDEKKVIIRKKILIKDRNKKKKKKIKMLKVEICAAKKEKIHRTKISYPVDISHLLLDSVRKKQFGKTLMDPVDAQNKKPLTVRSFTRIHNFKDIQPLKLFTKSLKEVAGVFPVHGILKNRTRITSTKKTTVIGDAQGSNLIKSCRELVKRVTFSGKDDILGHHMNCSPEELPQLQSGCKIFSDVLAASSGIDESSKGEKLPPAADGAQVINKQLSDVCDHAPTPINLSNRNHADTRQTSLGETVDLNNAMQVSSDLNCSSSYSSNPQILSSTYKEGLNSDGGIREEESILSVSTATTFPIPIGSRVSRSDATGSLTITRNLISQPSTSCLVASIQENERQAHLSVEPKMDIFSHIPEFQRKGHFSSKDFVSSICSSMDNKTFRESRLASDPVRICRDECINEDFIGLPLNSQGELIKLHSSGKFGFSELFKNQNAVLGSGHNYPFPYLVEPKSNLDHGKMKGKLPGAPLCRKDQINWFPDPYYPAREPVTSGLGITELQNFERMKIKNHELMRDTDQYGHHDCNPMKVSCYGCREYNKTREWMEREKFLALENLDHGIPSATPPTMRLMGKNVTVGKSSKECHGFDDGNLWTDKEVVAEQGPFVRVSDNPHSERWAQQEWVTHPACRTSKGNHLQSLEVPSSLYTPPTGPRFDHMLFDCQPQWMSNYGISSTIGNHGSKVNNSSHPFPPDPLLNKTSKSIIHCNSATESVEKDHQIPVVVSCPQNVCQHMLLSSTHCQHSQSLSYSTSTFHPPFTNYDHGNLITPSSAHSSSYLPQWLLNAKEQKKNNNTCSYSDPFASRLPCTMSGTNLLPFPSPYPASIIPFSICNTNSCGPSTPAPLAHPSFITAYPASKSTSALNANCRNKIKNRNGTKSKYTYVKGLNNASETNKRPADRRDEFMRPVKKLSLTVHGDSNAPTEPRTREQLHGYIPQNTGNPELHGYRNKRMDMDLALINNENDGFRASSRSSSSKFDSGLRSGPVKLSAGAKHILKPSQNRDPDNSRPIHSTIPFAVGTSSGKVSVSQKKATKVYRF